MSSATHDSEGRLSPWCKSLTNYGCEAEDFQRLWSAATPKSTDG